MPKPKVFISYSHRDEPQLPGRDDVRWLSYVKEHLKPLEDVANIEFWSDQNLKGSEDWETHIFAAIDACDIFVLLVSRYSLASDFIKNKEVPRLLERQRRNRSNELPALYPVLLTPCGAVRGYDWLRVPNIRPRNGKALSDFEYTAGKNDRDKVMAGIVNDIANLARTSADRAAKLTSPPPPPMPLLPPPATDVSRGMPPVSGSYFIPAPEQSRGASGQEPALYEITLALGFTGLSRITTPNGTLVFKIRQALLHTSIAGGTIAPTQRAFPEGWQGPRAQVTRIGHGLVHETLRLQADDGLDGEVLAGRGDAGHVRLFDVEPSGDRVSVAGEVQISLEAVHVDLDRSLPNPDGRRKKSAQRTRNEAELARLILDECGLTRLPLEGHGR